MTEYENKVSILSELWMSHKNNDGWTDFFEYNDIGLPLAFMIDQKVVESNEVGVRYIEETWELFCESLLLDDNEQYDDLQQMLKLSDANSNWEEDEYDEE